MKKRNILKESRDFDRIIKNNRPYKYKDYIIYIERKEQDTYHFGFSVGKKIGCAVTRNKIKRQLKAIVDKKNYQKGFNCIIIVGRGVLERTFQEMESNLYNAFSKLNIYEEEINEKNKKKVLIILLIMVLTLTGCTKQLKDPEGKIVTNKETGQVLPSNILCAPTDKDTLKLYRDNKKALEKNMLKI